MFTTLLSDTTSLVTISLAVTLIILFLYYYRYETKQNYPDGPIKFPILGNLPQIAMVGDMVRFFEKYRQIYGNVYTVEMGGLKRVVISGSDNMHHLLVKKADFTSNRTPNAMPARLIEIVKDKPGLFWAPYPHWKTIRTFALNVLREEGMGKTSMEHKILEEIDLYIQHFIDRHVKTPIRMTPSLTYATSNMISQMVVGKRFDYEDPNLHRLVTAFTDCVNANMKASITKNIPLAAYLPGDLSGQRLEARSNETIGPIIKAMVEQAGENLSTGNQNNFISQAMLEGRAEKLRTASDSSVFADGNIEVATAQLYVAGTETTSTALRWALLYMIVYPDIQERVRKEIHDFIGERQVSMRDRLILPYTDAVLHEVLRCANIVPTSVPHTLEREMVIEGKTVPEGAELLLNMHSILFDPELYSEPDQFTPVRFLGKNGQMLKSKLSPFGLGRRACLGEPLARMEFFLFFVTFLQKYKLSHPPNKKPNLASEFGIVRAPRDYEIIFERHSDCDD